MAFGHREIEGGGGEKIVDSGLRVDGKVGAVARSNVERGAGQQSVEPR